MLKIIQIICLIIKTYPNLFIMKDFQRELFSHPEKEGFLSLSLITSFTKIQFVFCTLITHPPLAPFSFFLPRWCCTFGPISRIPPTQGAA